MRYAKVRFVKMNLSKEENKKREKERKGKERKRDRTGDKAPDKCGVNRSVAEFDTQSSL